MAIYKTSDFINIITILLIVRRSYLINYLSRWLI